VKIFILIIKLIAVKDLCMCMGGSICMFSVAIRDHGTWNTLGHLERKDIKALLHASAASTVL